MTSQQTEEYIFKICSIKNWEIAKQIGVFKGFGIDLIDGYIHFSSKDRSMDFTFIPRARLSAVMLS